MIDIVKVTIPMETLMALLRKEAELRVLKEHISAEIESESSNYIDKKKIVLDEPIRTLGTHVIQIKLHKDVTAKMNVKVQEA